ncbi:hypothetical protein [Caudoviricetes sp.]|nr:hypothetical protein [Caudoviricetes sp.]
MPYCYKHIAIKYCTKLKICDIRMHTCIRKEQDQFVICL